MAPAILLAQAAISGIVKGDDGLLAGVYVKWGGHKIGAVTDANGYFIIDDLDAGAHFLEFSLLGYEKQVTKVNLKSGERKQLDVMLKPSPSSLNEVVISGTMKEVSKLQSPVPVEIYTPKFFQRNPTSNMFDALQMINGVQPTMNCNVCNTGDIHMNGMDGPYTMILIDGMPIVSALSTVYGLSGIPNSMIERIEIVKGPASTLYGSEAVAGLINVITKKPEKAAPFTFDMYGTTYDEWNFDAGMGYHFKKVSGFFSANFFHFNRVWDKNQDQFTDLTLQKRFSAFNKLTFKRRQNKEASLAFRFFNEDRWGGQTHWTEQWKGTDSIYGESIQTNRFEALASYALPVQEKIKITASYNYHYQHSWYGTMPYFGRQHVAFAQLVWDKKIGLRHDLLSGVTYRHTFYDDNSVATQTATGAGKPAINYLPGLFVQDEISLHKKHKLLFGMRYDYFNNHGSIFSPRVNYKWTPASNHTLRFTAGNGFRVVNLFTEDHAALSGARDVVIAERLKPEESWNVNLNHQWLLHFSKAFLTLDATLFYTYFSNRILANYDQDPTKIIYANLKGNAISRGFSCNADMNFTFPLKLNAGITLMNVFKREQDADGNFTTSQQIHAPGFSGTFQVSYTFTRLGLRCDWTGQVYGPMRLPVVPNDFRPEYSPWFSLQNIQFTKIYKNYEWYGGIKNIFNFMPENPILRPFDPFDKSADDVVSNPNGYRFDPSYNFAPLQGIRFFAGFRYMLR